MVEYHKIETLYERDNDTHKLKEPLVLKNSVYGIIKTWEFTEKVNGTNVRVDWDPKADFREELEFEGRNQNSQFDPQLLKYLRATFTPEKFQAAFPDGGSVILYGEGFGAGIQKGGIYSKRKQFILFDVLIDRKWWLSWENVKDVARKLNIPTVPFIGEMTLEEATEMVRNGFQTRIPEITGDGDGGPAEGLIGRPVEALFDKKGARLIIKIKTKDFAIATAPKVEAACST